MKQNRRRIWLLIAVCTIILTALSGCRGKAHAPASAAQQHASATVVTPHRQLHHEATLTDASQIYRVCSSRPQRILPSQGFNSARTLIPCGSLARRYNVNFLHTFFDSRRRKETAPFCLSVSRDYYVIALRHIIC